jgi:DnaD/phage-associated family protein
MAMKGFGGFPQKGRLTKIPGLFFSDLLPQIDSLPELKVTLYCFWRLQQKEGQLVYLTGRELSADPIFLSGLGARDDECREALQDGLERAVTRGTLLHVQVTRDDKYSEDLYFVNTPRGRAAVEGIKQGKWHPDHIPDPELDLTVERPNIFTLYEQNIGPLTPMIADHLRNLDEEFPVGWIEEAIEIAVTRNARKLSYVEGILNRWQRDGRSEDDVSQPRNGSEPLSGKYQDEVER